jgi:hypothetical protein
MMPGIQALEEILRRAADGALTTADQKVLNTAIADKALIVVQRGKYIVNAGGGQSLEIGDRYAEGDLERIERALKEAGVARSPEIFQDLSDLLKNPQRHPNLLDFQRGAYYRNAELHRQVEARLLEGRRCLIRGKPGRGKSTLAKAVGYELMRADPKHAVFYLNAKNNASVSAWMKDIYTRDLENVTFIIDDCHRAVDAVNGLVDDWFRIKCARLILVSRTLAERLATSDETNYLAELRSESVSIDSVPADFTLLIASVVAQHGGSWRDAGSLEEVIPRCEGDLFILDYLVKQWLLLPAGVGLAEVDPGSIGESLYNRYIPKLTPYPDAILTIAALSQFEIDVDSRFIGSSNVIDSLKESAFIETSTGDGLFLRFFHSTPAKHLVSAARGPTAVDFTKAELLRYIAAEPANVFEVFHQLALNDEEGLRMTVLASAETSKAVGNIADAAIAISDTDLKSLLRFLLAAHVFERRTSMRLQLLSPLIDKAREWATFIANRTLPTITSYLTFMQAIGAGRPEVLLAPRTLRRLGERSGPTLNLTELLSFLRAAKAFGTPPSDLQEFVNGVELKGLGQRMSGVGFGRLVKSGHAIRELGVTSSSWGGFWDGIDCRALGEHARDQSLVQIWNFLQTWRRAGLAGAHLRAFFAGLNLHRLGSRANERSFHNVLNFIFNAKRGGITDAELGAFYDALDWVRLGSSIGDAGERHKSLFFDLQLVADTRNTGITRQMARDFVKGFGWTRLQSLITERASPDVLAVIKRMLVLRCGYSDRELASHHVDLGSCTLWLRSFKTHPSPGTNSEGQARLQSYYLREALSIFRSCVSAPDYFEKLELSEWNTLSRNLIAADPQYFDDAVLPRIMSLGDTTLSSLFRRADLYSLHIFLQRFHRLYGVLTGGFPKGAIVDVNDLIRKLGDSNVETISGLLFSLQSVGRMAESSALAAYINENVAQFAIMFETATLRTLDWFGWNLWCALPTYLQSRVYEHGAYISAVIAHRLGTGASADALLGIVGCMHLCGNSIPQAFRNALHSGRAKQICRANANSKKPALIRTLAGAVALDLLRDDNLEREFYRKALQDTVVSLEVRNEKVVAVAAELTARLSE